jgi:hypothetical protein
MTTEQKGRELIGADRIRSVAQNGDSIDSLRRDLRREHDRWHFGICGLGRIEESDEQIAGLIRSLHRREEETTPGYRGQSPSLLLDL